MLNHFLFYDKFLIIFQDAYQLAPINPAPVQMMLGGSGGAPSFDSRPPGSLAPGGPVGTGDGSEAPLPPPANVPLQRPSGQPSGENY